MQPPSYKQHTHTTHTHTHTQQHQQQQHTQGKQKLGALVNVPAHWVIGLPAAYYFSFVVGWGVPGLWMGLGCAVLTQVLLDGSGSINNIACCLWGVFEVFVSHGMHYQALLLTRPPTPTPVYIARHCVGYI